MNALKLVREVDRQINNGELSYEEGVALLNPLFDVESITRCNHCNHYEGTPNQEVALCNFWKQMTANSHFCSEADRRIEN